MEKDRKLSFINPSNGLFLKQVDSTNKFILAQGVKGGFVVSETQTSGRGRNSRTWFSDEPNNLYFSALVELETVHNISLLSLLCGKAVHKTCKDFFPDLKLTIKWPNDIYLENKKIAGILLETRVQKSSLLVVIGIGVNFYFSNLPPDIPNIGMLLNSPPTGEFKMQFIKKLIDELNQSLFNFQEHELAKNDLDYVYKYSYLRNKKIQFEFKNSIFIGEFVGYNEQGFLLLNFENQIYVLQDTNQNFGVIEND